MDSSAVFQIPPILAVEVVSPSTSTVDYRYKQTEYAAIKILEYWIVDNQFQKITIFNLIEGLYEKLEFLDNFKIVSQIFPNLQPLIPLKKVRSPIIPLKKGDFKIIVKSGQKM